MELIHGFKPVEFFYDDTHFPRGFNKSGEFSISESEILTTLGKRLFMLENKFCFPETIIEEQFVQNFRSENTPQTKVELVWGRYKTLTRKKEFHTLPYSHN
tara:strand:+ start:388 stop:690 length:303 start_codon:yes stop_codon:yes gene_type:complete